MVVVDGLEYAEILGNRSWLEFIGLIERNGVR